MAVIKHIDQRVGLFIDTQNLYHSAKHLFDNARVNFSGILRDAIAGRRLIRAMAYVISTKSGEEQAFFDALGKIGIETRVKELQEFYGGAKKADWDVGLAVDAITLAPKLDAVIIASGDGDFVPLVEYLRINTGVQVEVVAFGQSTSSKLREAADDFFDLSSDPEAYLIGYRGGYRQRGRQESDDTPEEGGDPRSRRAVSL
ncbi:MAG TPA: NYN domain-containing protein [Candidatus Paceibacterota bacterium]|nr:NYN domain-containing protein [Candidatus Paceibacterota bacterium]